MNTVPPAKPETIPAADVRPGMHLIEGTDDVTVVAHAMPYTDANHAQGIALMVHPLTRSDAPILAKYRPDFPLRLATDAEIAAARDHAGRHEFVEGLRALADFYETHPALPMPSSPDFTHCVGTADDDAGRAEIALIAAELGVEPKDGLHAKRRFGPIQYHAFYNLRAEMQRYNADQQLLRSLKTPAAPAADPEGFGYSRPAEDDVEPYDPHLPAEGEGRSLTGRTGNTGEQPIIVPRVVEHYHASGSTGGPGENSATCACGVSFDGFDAHAEARAQLNIHIAAFEANKTAAERDDTTSSADAVREGSSSDPVRAAAAPVAPLGVGATGVTPDDPFRIDEQYGVRVFVAPEPARQIPRGYDPHPTVMLARGQTPEQWYQTYARSLDSLVPHWYRDDLARMAGELAAEAKYRLNVEAGQ